MYTGVYKSGVLTIKRYGDYETVKDWVYGYLEYETERKAGDTVYIETMGCCVEQWIYSDKWEKVEH